MMSSMQLGSNCLTRTLLPAPSQQTISRHSRLVATRVATRSPALIQAPSSEQTRQQLEEAFEAPPAAPAQVLPSPVEGLAQASASASAATAGAAPSEAKVSAARRNIILIDGDTLESSNEHRAWVAGGMLLFGSLFAVGASQIHDLPSAIGATAAAGSAYLTADLLSGVYHWGVDNYGDGSTPVFGSQIAGFQAHHQRPWTITEREFANNVYKVFQPAVPFAAACLLASPALPPWACVWLSTATFFTVMSQQFHAWSHMKASQLPAPVLALQDAGVLISRKAHGAHHKAPFEGNYCIVSGFWNNILDQEGSEKGAFRVLERAVHTLTGVEPRCWNEPSYDCEVLDSEGNPTTSV